MKGLTISRLLVPFNFSASSIRALDTAINLSKEFQARVTLFQVIDNTTISFSPGREITFLPVGDLTRVARANLEALTCSLSGKYQIPVDYLVDAGSPASKICSVASQNNFDLIILGTSERNRLRRFFVGSTVYRVVKNSICPVLSVPSNVFRTSFQKIMFPIRNAPNMMAKYDLIRPLIEKYRASLILAAVTRVNDSVGFARVHATLDGIRSKVHDDHVPYTTHVHLCESISRRVLDVSNDERPDMIVITSMVLPSLKRFFLEHYTKNIVSRAQCPVLSIRTDENVMN